MKRKLNILLADDDDSFRLLVERAIAGQPEIAERCALYCVADGAGALDYLFGRGAYAERGEFPMPDLVLLDQRMGRIDGCEVLEETRKDPAGRMLPVCFLTSAPAGPYEPGHSGGASFCISKPLDFDALRRKLRLIVEFFTEVLELPDRRSSDQRWGVSIPSTSKR